MKTDQLQLTSGGCNGDNKENQRQSQGKAQKTDCRQGHAQKDRDDPKKGGEKGAPSANSEEGKVTDHWQTGDRRQTDDGPQTEANRATPPISPNEWNRWRLITRRLPKWDQRTISG
jgi:hypothetical protein